MANYVDECETRFKQFTSFPQCANTVVQGYPQATNKLMNSPGLRSRQQPLPFPSALGSDGRTEHRVGARAYRGSCAIEPTFDSRPESFERR